MRRSLLAIIASSVLVVACSEQPTAPTVQRANPAGPPALVVGDPACSEPTGECIQTLINALFPKGDLLKSANGFWSNIQTKVRQQRLLDAQARATDLVNFGLKNFYANKLIGGKTTQLTVDNLIALNDAVYGFTGLSGAPTIPPEVLAADAAAVILGPQSPTTLVITETKQAGVIVPAGAAGTTTLVSINRLPDSPGPLLTSLNQFPLFYQFTTTPEITFNQDVTTGVCQSQDFEPYGALRLAHNVEDVGDDGSFGDIEILPRVAAPFLDCSNATGPIGALDHRGLTGLASAGWSLLGRTVGPVAKAIFLPDDLYAAALGTCCLGGTGKKFSPHGAVDPTSNPGSLGIVDENGDPTSGDVSGPGTVYVKAASQNETPIQNVPVSFGGTTVLTEGDGIASFLWDATPGTTLTATVPNEFSELGPSCPDGIPEPAPNTKYRPLVCFTPSSVTFTAPALPPEVTFTLAGPVTFLTQCEGEPSVCSEAFTQDGYELQSFWLNGDDSEPQGAVLQRIGGHFHMVNATVFNGFEGHHWQGDFSRQGIRIRRANGGTFSLQSVEYRPRESFPGTPFEIGTSPITSIVVDQTETYFTLASGYTTFPAPAGDFTFQTVPFSGFEDVTEVYITMRGAADWRNIVLTQGP